MKTPILYFAYGSNMNPDRIARRCPCDYFAEKTALDIVVGMKMNPFNASLTPHEFMLLTLRSIGQKDFPLPDDPDRAALFFCSD